MIFTFDVWDLIWCIILLGCIAYIGGWFAWQYIKSYFKEGEKHERTAGGKSCGEKD